MSLPTDEEIRALHEKYAPNREAFDIVYNHCQIVLEIADDLLKVKPQPQLNYDLVHAGCLLHDIGVYRLYGDNGELDFSDGKYIQHGLRGAEVLAAEGMDPALVRIASHHTGLGLTTQEIIADNLPLPHEDLMAETAEERLVMYADKFNSKHQNFNQFETYRQKAAEYSEEDAARFDNMAAEFGKPQNLEAMAAKYGQPLV